MLLPLQATGSWDYTVRLWNIKDEGLSDEEAVRVVEKMPSWKPGKQRGKSVRVQYNLPIRFTLR